MSDGKSIGNNNSSENLFNASNKFIAGNSINISGVKKPGETNKTQKEKNIRSNENASGNNGSGIPPGVGMLKAQGFSTKKPDLKVITGGFNNVIKADFNNVIKADTKFQATGNKQVDEMLSIFDDPLKFAKLVYKAERSRAGDIFAVSEMDKALDKALANLDRITPQELKQAQSNIQEVLNFPPKPTMTPDEEAQLAIDRFNNRAA